ncbi:MAG TPA: hypothetical protein VHX38_06765 [Pseudonocardiaceae bacterium]|jgi:hypothetical protein|nr:hypothetical protein [Pseudonocardiaceae bacterium]
MSEGAVSRGALVGSIISAAFGIGWCQWGAFGITGTAAIVVRVLGAVLGVALIVGCVRARRELRTDPAGAAGSRSMFAARGYRIVVLIEVIALAGGAAVFGVTGRTEYQIAWFALVVGVHFVAFGRLFATRFYLLGAALIAAAVLGTVIGLAGGSAGLVEAVTGFASAVSLFVAAILTIRQLPARHADMVPAAS